jgi:hypothetical protein
MRIVFRSAVRFSRGGAGRDRLTARKPTSGGEPIMKSFQFVGLFIIAIGITAASSPGGTYSLVPVSASGTHSIIGNEIRLQGPGQQVTLELRISDWDPQLLRTYQATIDSSGYTTALAGSLAPTFVACGADSECVTAFGTGSSCERFCDGGTNDGTPCNVDGNCPGGTCEFVRCKAGFQDTTRPDWVFAGLQILNEVSTFSLDYAYGATTFGATVADTGEKYAGTLLLSVSPDAIGTFTIGFIDDIGATFMDDGDGFPIPVDTLNPALVTVLCDSPEDCDDNNACTTDSCSAQGVCTNVPNYNTNTHCCNPANGDLTPLSDGNECTQDVCDTSTGQVTHPPRAAGASCGSAANTECDNPDTCDGAGNCLDNFEPSGTACGDPTNTECNPADTCNGAGSCQTIIAPAGTACGDPSSGPCDNPDTCNGFGACLSNTVPNGTQCDDGLFCTVSTTCSGGVCAGGAPRNCSDSLTCTTDSCNEDTDQCDNILDPNRCLIGGICYVDGNLNPANTCEECDSVADPLDWTVLPDGTLCNDGDACTGTGREGIGFDTCTEGVCEGVVDPECNDQCEFAVEAIEGVNESDNSSAGPIDDAEASCQPDSNNDVWFFYTAKCDGQVLISTTGSAMLPINDPVLSVYDDCPGDGGVEIACDDDSGLDLNAALVFNVTANETYYIRIAGFQSNAGPIILNLRPFDDCLIDGVCYQKDDLNPGNECQACIPELSTITWSNLAEATPCGDDSDTDCDAPDACNGLGVCEENWKPDGTTCTDEPNECTDDVCESGICIHPPVAAGIACGDPTDTDCDDPDTCDGGGTCAPNYAAAGFPCGDPSTDECDNPDICDGVGVCLDNLKPDGTPCDDFDVCTDEETCDAGVCVGVPIPEAPIVEGYGSLALLVTPEPPGSVAPVALRLTSPTWPCVDKYIDADGSLTDVPVFQLPDDWGTVLVQGPEIYPSTMDDLSVYDVVAECGAFTSPIGSGATWVWGDLNNDNNVNFEDISLILEAFKTQGGMNGFDPIFDVAPCPPNGVLNFGDISIIVDAFRGEPYPCPPPCP